MLLSHIFETQTFIYDSLIRPTNPQALLEIETAIVEITTAAAKVMLVLRNGR